MNRGIDHGMLYIRCQLLAEGRVSLPLGNSIKQKQKNRERGTDRKTYSQKDRCRNEIEQIGPK